MSFSCNVCHCVQVAKYIERGDGRRIQFCADCGMGTIEDPPESTEAFYEDGYYGQTAAGAVGYEDYAFTAEHGLLWVRLFIEAAKPYGGRVLDIGCADGFLLRRLVGPYECFGIEVNGSAAAQAARHDVTILSSDVADPSISVGKVGRFDVITSIATFEHVLDFSGAIRKCLDLLTHNGVLLFEVPLISDHRDNRDWFNSSYEHISYPTISGLQRLFDINSDAYFSGFESDIKGYGSTYIGAATRDPEMFASIDRLLRVMVQDGLKDLSVVETRLNLAYHLVHCFRPTPERVLALPALLDVAATPNLLKRLTQLWYGDSVRALEAEANSAQAQWMEKQATNWQNAYHELASTVQKS